MTTLTSTTFPRLISYVVGPTPTQGPFDIPFPFYDLDTVDVYVDGVEIAAYEVTQAELYGTEGNFVTLDDPVSNALVSIVSNTGEKRSTGDSFVQVELSREIDRMFALFQEIKQRGFFSLPDDTAIDFGGRVMKNLADPVDDTDAATKGSARAQASAHEDAAADYAAAAASSATAADSSATAADNSAQAAAASAEAAQVYKLVWRDTWATATGYDLHDVVFSNGSSYVCAVTHISDAATEPGIGASWADKWDLVAAKGDTGATGDTGLQGPQGDPGVDGAAFDTDVAAAPVMTDPADGDKLGVLDASASFALNALTWGTVKSKLNIAPTVTVYNTAAAAFTHNLQADTKRIRVRMVGGGGGAAGCRGTEVGTASVGAPGHGGSYVEGELDVSALTELTVTIGAGGAGSYGNNDGASGGATVLVAGAVTWTAAGGLAGLTYQNVTTTRFIDTGFPVDPSAVGAQIVLRGGWPGHSILFPGSTNAVAELLAGAGGDSPFGLGGKTRVIMNANTAQDGWSGQGNGSGGGGCGSSGTGGFATGGSGTPGMMIIEEFPL